MRVRRNKPVIYIAAALILTLVVSSGTAFGLEMQLAEPEIVTAPPNSLIENPTPRVQMEIQPNQSKKLRKATEAALPEQYDLRDKNLVTPVKDQGSFGTCWAFAAMACAETSAIKSGIAEARMDLSEAHLAYFYYNRVGDPLGNTNGDKNVILSKDYKGERLDYRNMGGDDKKTILALSGWTGAAEETIAPYQSLLANIPFAAGKAYQNSYILKNGYILPTDRSTIKQALMKYGAVNIGYYADDEYSTDDGAAAYCDRLLTANHEVVIVGWDDNYSKTNFRDGCQPDSDGAWIVKNSWGRTSGIDGYFYLSYEDQTLCDVVVYDFQPAGTYDHNYQYDGTANFRWWENIKNGDKFSNVYQIKGNKAGYDEVLSAVGFVSYTPGSQYNIQIYKNPKAHNPESGTPLLKKPVTGTVDNAGFMTKELGSALVLPQNTVYSIVITFTKVPQKGATIGAELNERIEGFMDYRAEVTPGQSYVKEGSTWTDMYDYDACLRIKGFTRNGKTKTPSAVGKVQISRTSASMKLGSALTLKATLLPEHAANKKVIWKSSNQKIATVDAKGKITAVGPGSAVITAVSASNPDAKSSCKIKVSSVPLVSIKATSASYNKIRVAWKKVTPADGCQVYRAASKNGTYKRIKTIKGSSYTDSGRQTGKRYYYKVRAYKNAGGKTWYGKFSESVNVKPKPGKSVLTLKSGKKKIAAKWSKVSGVSGYQLYRAKSKKGKYIKIRQTVKRNYTNTGLRKNKRYYYKVRAYKTVKGKKVYGSFSAVKAVKTK